MTVLVIIARVEDGLILSEAMDSPEKFPEVEQYRAQAKKLLKTLSRKSEPRLSIESGAYYFAYIIMNDVCYITLCENSYPRKLAFNFLEELQREFDIQHGSEVSKAKRPYSFIKFDTFISKTRKVYTDTRSQRNLNKVTEELSDVHRIMTKNITDILGRGEKIQSVASKADELLSSTAAYKKMAKDLNADMFLRKYGPVIVIFLVVFLVLYFKFW